MSTKDAPSHEDGTTDASTTNNNGFQRGWFTDLRLAENAPDHLADFTAVAAHHPDIDVSVNHGVQHGTADITAFDRLADDDEPVIDYDLPCKEFNNGYVAIRVGQFVNKDSDVYVVGPTAAIYQAVEMSLEADASDLTQYQLDSGPMHLSRKSKILLNVVEYLDFAIGTWHPSRDLDDVDVDEALEDGVATAIERDDGYIVAVERVREDRVAGWVIETEDESVLAEQMSRVVAAAKAVEEVASSPIRLETMGDV